MTILSLYSKTERKKLGIAVATVCSLFVLTPSAQAYELAALGNKVWYDCNMNGLQDKADCNNDGTENYEPGVPGATVQLQYCDGTPTSRPDQTTTAYGLYFFDDLVPGDYKVTFIPPAGYTFTIQDAGAEEWQDSDADPATGMTACVTLAEGDVNKRVDAGLIVEDGEEVGTGTPGYWKNHPEAWPISKITIGGVMYSKDEAIQIIKDSRAEGHDKTKTIFRSLVAAILNGYNGADTSCIDDTIEEADAWMASNGPVDSGVEASSDAWYEGEPLYHMLDDYNNGKLCAPSRD